MTCWLTAPSHFLPKYWLRMRGALWNLAEGNLTRCDQSTIFYIELKIWHFKATATSLRDQWVKWCDWFWEHMSLLFGGVTPRVRVFPCSSENISLGLYSWCKIKKSNPLDEIEYVKMLFGNIHCSHTVPVKIGASRHREHGRSSTLTWPPHYICILMTWGPSQ